MTHDFDPMPDDLPEGEPIESRPRESGPDRPNARQGGSPGNTGPADSPAPSPGETTQAAWRPELAEGGGEDEMAMRMEDAFGSSASPESELPVEASAGGLKGQLTRANLFFFGIFLIGIGLVAFMSLRGGPDQTAANDQKQQQVDTAVDQFLTRQDAISRASGGALQPAGEDLVNDTQALVNMFYNYQKANQVPLEDLKKNPFTFASRELSPDAKSAAEKARLKAEEARQQRLIQEREQFKALKLQMVLSGTAGRQAMVNNSMVKEGDELEGFTVRKIEARRVLFTRDGEEFILEMGL